MSLAVYFMTFGKNVVPFSSGSSIPRLGHPSRIECLAKPL